MRFTATATPRTLISETDGEDNKMKMKYETPELEITLFEEADIITTSGLDEFEDDILGQGSNP